LRSLQEEQHKFSFKLGLPSNDDATNHFSLGNSIPECTLCLLAVVKTHPRSFKVFRDFLTQKYLVIGLFVEDDWLAIISFEKLRNKWVLTSEMHITRFLDESNVDFDAPQGSYQE
jgi:hypothetical protein